MCYKMFKILLLLAFIQQCVFINAEASLQNKTTHHPKKPLGVSFFKNTNVKRPSYRSFQPVSIKYHKTNTYPRADDRADYDITSYDTEYGGVVSNFTSSIYDDNSALYPNPEFLSRSNQVMNKPIESKMTEVDVELPDDSLADADLKEHNIIDSVTYLYGFSNCHGGRHEWMILIFINCGIAIIMIVSAMTWLMWSEHAAEFRRGSKLYPININLCCCLAACTLIYVQAVMGVSSTSQCERIALLLHYTYLSCSMWIVALAAAVAEYSTCDTMLPLKYNYLLAYGVPAIVVMFNYALSMEHYEVKHYCWMSIEKGMVMGFMVPVMILILINTGIIIIGLQSVNKKQAEILSVKLQELVDNHIASWPKNNQNVDNKNASMDPLDVHTPGSSRKNTDSSETLDGEYDLGEDEYQYENMTNEDAHADNGNEQHQSRKNLINSLDLENLSWSWNMESNELKIYLNLCLILEPFFAINWVMGVVAIENATHWSTPTVYLILVVAMYVYLTVTICTTLPMVQSKNSNPPSCEDVIIEPSLPRARTTDSIPLLDPANTQPLVTLTPADTISTISI